MKNFFIMIFTYFRLRPELYLFVLSFVILLTVLLKVNWTDKLEEEEFIALSRFEMIDIQVPQAQAQEEQPEEPEPDLAEVQEIEQKQEEKKKEEKKEEKHKEKPKGPVFSFGNTNANYQISALAVKPPQPRAPLPAYPEAMQKAGIEGVVVVEIGIDENGKVVYGRIVKHVHPSLDELVINWVKNVDFYPAMTAEGEPFPVKLFWPIRFMLTD